MAPPFVEVRYDPAAIQGFVSRVPEGLRTNLLSGREFLRDTLVDVRVHDGLDRPTVCPVYGDRKFPGLGFNKEARVQMQPSPEGLLRNASCSD
jgi:hypothetical protein